MGTSRFLKTKSVRPRRQHKIAPLRQNPQARPKVEILRCDSGAPRMVKKLKLVNGKHIVRAACAVSTTTFLRKRGAAVISMVWTRTLAYITGTVDPDLPLRNECLAAENRILKGQLEGRLKLSDAERATLGEIAHRLGRKALEETATAVKAEIIPTWYRRLMARKFDGSKQRRGPGRPRINAEVEELIA
jgi:hypothetical protein